MARYRATCKSPVCGWEWPVQDGTVRSEASVNSEMDRHEDATGHETKQHIIETDGGSNLPERIDWPYDAVMHNASPHTDCLALTGKGQPCSYQASRDNPVCSTHDRVDDPDLVEDGHQWTRIEDLLTERVVAVCVNCEQVWENGTPALFVDCPECGESAGDRCRNPDSTFGATIPPHPKRREIGWETVDDYEPCSGSPVDEQIAVTDGGSKYVVATGPGYLGVWSTSGWTANICIGTFQQYDWREFDECHAFDHEHGVLLSTDWLDEYEHIGRGRIEKNSVGVNVKLASDVMQTFDEFRPGDDVRAYEHDDGLLIVLKDSDPLVNGGETA